MKSMLGKRARRAAVLVSFAVCGLALTGCGAVAAPCRVASAGLKIVPVVGHLAAAPTDACAAVIDP
ncbi:conserved exported hypothetical protein [Paraburkholderia tropica]|nr:conserved exported hypothetical protein [Paraburkholderia tropica]